jgi:putative component of toxin-antitoxin plasmid stabilization module
MKPAWEFWPTVTQRSNVLLEWFGRDKAFQARADSTLRRLQHMLTWPMPYYRPLGGGVGEIRFDYNQSEQRIYGFFADRRFIVLFGKSGKQGQQEAIKRAKTLKKQFDKQPWKTEKYDV